MTMNCDLAAELLPWLVNGTLEAGERRELIAHLRGCGACRAALADTQVAFDLFDWHPPAAALVAYVAAGEGLAPAGDAAMAEHLASCPKCAAELELVRTSRLLADPAEDGRIAILPAPREEVARRPGAAAPAAAAIAAAAVARPGAPATASAAATPAPAAIRARRDDAAARRAWQRSALAASLVGLLAATGWIESARHSRDLERRLAATPAPAGAAVTPSVPAPPATSSPGEAELRRRAGEAEATLRALTQKNQQLQQQVAALDRTATEMGQRSAAVRSSQPESGPPIESVLALTDVQPAEQVERGAGGPAAEAIPLSSGAATLFLHTRYSGSHPGYELEVRDVQGRLVGKPTRVFPTPGERDSFEEFGLTLRRRALPPGAYTLHLFGLGGGAGASGRVALETYSIRVS